MQKDCRVVYAWGALRYEQFEMNSTKPIRVRCNNRFFLACGSFHQTFYKDLSWSTTLQWKKWLRFLGTKESFSSLSIIQLLTWQKNNKNFRVSPVEIVRNLEKKSALNCNGLIQGFHKTKNSKSLNQNLIGLKRQRHSTVTFPWAKWCSSYLNEQW